MAVKGELIKGAQSPYALLLPRRLEGGVAWIFKRTSLALHHLLRLMQVGLIALSLWFITDYGSQQYLGDFMCVFCYLFAAGSVLIHLALQSLHEMN